MNLYKIDMAIMEAFEKAVDAETGEILDEAAFTELDNLQMMRDEKIEGLLLWIKNLTADAEALKREKMAFEDRQRSVNKRIESLKRYVISVIAGQKFRTDRVAVSWRKSKVTEYDGDVELLPEDCISRKPPEVNKTELKKLLETGAKIPGARIIEKQNMIIK